MTSLQIEIGPKDTLPLILAQRAAATPDRSFVEEVDGASYTYQQFHHLVKKWAQVYRSLGVAEGDRVAIFMPPAINTAASWLGLSWLKAIEVPINTNYLGDMLHYIISDSGAKVLLIDDRYLDRLTDVADRLPNLESVIVMSARAELPRLKPTLIDGDRLLTTSTGIEDVEAPKPWNLAGILYTGGTTGPSKGVMIPWGYYMNSIQTLNYLGPDDAFYAPFPMFHGTGKVPFLAMVAFGGRVVIREQFRTQDFWRDVDNHKCTISILLPAMAKWVLALPSSDDDKKHSLKYVTMISDIDAFRKRFNVIVNTHFGMTEAGVPLGRNNVTDNFTSCGKVKPGYEVRIVDDLDYEVPVGEVGELIVRTSQPWTLSQGYFGKPEKTWEAWRNGWLHTGDAMRRDAEGNHYFVDRKRDYMRRRGENISSFEVEAIVSQHPDLTGVAAIGVPSEHGEDEVKIVATRRPGSTLTPEELIRFLIPRMPRFMVPRYIEFVDVLPRTPSTQHVRKVELRVNPLNENTWDREAAGIEIPR